MTVVHLLITRFALRLKRTVPADTGPLSPDWLERRLDLFRRYCVPSVQAQYCSDFRWLVHVHAGLDPVFADRLRALDPRIALTTAPVTPLPRIEGADIVVSTRLDSDDSLAPHVLDIVQAKAQAKIARPVLVDFPKGYYVDHDTQQQYLAHGAAFKALIERQGPDRRCVGVYTRSCDVIALAYPTIREQEPSWLRIVHGGNLVNRFNVQRRARPLIELADQGFPWLREVA